MLRWAYERAGLDADDLIERFPQLPAWERGEANPTLKQLESFAKATYAPIGFLFLSEPPVEPVPIPDFRTMQGRSVARPSPNLLEMVYACEQRQEWFRDLARSTREAPLAFVGSATLSSHVVATATAMRDALGFSLDERKKYGTWTTALRRFIEQADDLGVLVMVSGIVGSNTRRKLDPEEFRGFALSDTLAPLVFINGADTKAAQMFTLAHELAHVWLGQTALSNVGLLSTTTNDVERWCNRVAAELLVPLVALRAEHRKGAPLRAETDRLARIFKVSTLVVLRRLHDLGALTREQLSKAYADELARLTAIVRERDSGGGDFYLTQAARVGKRFARALIVSTLEGQTLHRDALRLLGFSKTETFRELGHSLGIV
jgi:Zn-dependent peptidase ImmA (M78 family)/transcriptional regulator with XRE-family HTH domain